jgi:hypothetical protein
MQFSNDPKRELRRTFRKPRGRARKGSLLLMLRADLQSLYGSEAKVSGTIATPLFVALGVSAGLELLAKYWSGKTRTTQADVRDFLVDVSRLPNADAEALVQFRNALAHGYGLATRRVRDERPFMFSVDADTASGPVIAQTAPDEYVVYLWPLKRLFLESVKRCRRAIATDWRRMLAFVVCIRNLREIRVSKVA